MAKKSKRGDLIISKRHTKGGAAKLTVSSDFYMALDKKAGELIAAAKPRAMGSKGKTVEPQYPVVGWTGEARPPMNEQTVVTLLSKLVGRFLDQLRHDWTEEERADIATRLADGAWNALVLLIRQALARGTTLTLDELGRFEKTESGWSFEPAASLMEAAALARPAERGARDVASTSLFYLHQALKLLQHLPSDIALGKDEALTPEQGLLQAIFGERAVGALLSSEVEEVAAHLSHAAARIRRRTGSQKSTSEDETTRVFGPAEAYAHPIEPFAPEPAKRGKATPTAEDVEDFLEE